jgi:hypothetical protein
VIALLRRLFGRDGSTCRCGHPAAVHEHFRRGRTHCGPCGPIVCDRYRRATWLHPAQPPLDPYEVERDAQAIDAVIDGDPGYAQLVAPDVVRVLTGLAALADTDRRVT